MHKLQSFRVLHVNHDKMLGIPTMRPLALHLQNEQREILDQLLSDIFGNETLWDRDVQCELMDT